MIPATTVSTPELKVRQFKNLYETGKSIAPPMAILSAPGFAFLAYSSRNLAVKRFGVTPFALYTTAAVLLPLFVPFTLAVMEPGPNKMLLAWAREAEKGTDAKLEVQGSEVDAELRTWVGMNAVRTGIAGTAALLGTAAVVLF